MKNEIIYEKLLEIEKMLKLSTDEIFNIDGAADFLKLKKPTLYQMIHKREIPFFKPTKRVLFTKLSLIEWVNKSRIKNAEELEREAKRGFNIDYKNKKNWWLK